MFRSTRSLAILSIDSIGIGLANLFLIYILNSLVNTGFTVASFTLIIIANAVSGAYSQLWRYTSFREVQNLFLSNVFSFCSLLILNSLSVINIQLFELFDFSQSIFCIVYLLEGTTILLN